MKIIALAAGALIASVSIAAAQSPIDTRQANQAARINQGVAKGQLNPNEAARLARGQARVQRAEDRAKLDGVVTRGEQRRVNNLQNQQSRKIQRLRTNNR